MRAIRDIKVLLLLFLAFGRPSWTQSQGEAQAAASFRGHVQEVVLDVIARDVRGRPAKNLRPVDIQVFEDGQPQEIRSLRLIEGGEAPNRNVNPLKAINVVCIVFHNIDPGTKKFAMETAQAFLKNQFQPDTWIGVFNLDARLTALYPFTTNRNAVVQAASIAFTGVPADFASSASMILSAVPNQMSSTQTGSLISGGGLSSLANNSAEVSNDAGANAVRGNVVEMRRAFNQIEGMRQTDQIVSMIDQLQGIPGRKSVLLLSPGLATTGDPDRFKAIIDRAKKAGITYYALDVNGLSMNSNALASGGVMAHAATVSAGQGAPAPALGGAGASMESARQGDYVHDAVRTSDTQASLRALSEGTGGFLIGNTNDFRKPFQRVVDDVDSYYEVIYRPTSQKYDGRLHTIEVKAAHGDLTLQSRTGYFALPPSATGAEPAPYEIAALAALSQPTPPRQIDFHVAAYIFRPEAGGARHMLAFEIPAAKLSATPESQTKRHRVHISLLALVKDGSGQVVEKFNQDSPYDIPDDQLAAAQKSNLTFTHPVSLPAGQYTVEAALLDRESHQAAVARVEFTASAQQGVGLSSVVLVHQVEAVNGSVDTGDPLQYQARPNQGVRMTPELVTEVSTNTRPSVYFVVYPDKASAEKPKIQVEVSADGKPLANQTTDLPAADATGAIPMVIKAPAMPGKCELKITAIQGSSQATQSLLYSVAAK